MNFIDPAIELRPYRVDRSIPSERCRDFRNLTLRWAPHLAIAYADPVPSAAQLAEFYTHEYRQTMNKARGFAAYLESPNYRARAASQVSWVMPLAARKGRWLDVGAAFGILLWQVKQQLPAWELHAVEPASDAHADLAAIARVERDFTAFWAGKTVSMGFFDVVSLSHVLEHLIDPLAALKQLHSRLKPGGLLLLEVPNDHFVELLREERASDLPHLWFFSKDGMTLLAEAAGFNVLRAAEVGVRRPGAHAALHKRAARRARRLVRGPLSLCGDPDWYAEEADRCDLRLLCWKPA